MNLKSELTFQLFFWNEMMGQKWYTLSGDTIEFQSLGEWNFHDGPDFIGAGGTINGAQWHGDVEIHTVASDWYLHQHHKDRAYDHVKIHVVYDFGNLNKFPELPTIVLKDQWKPNPILWQRKAMDEKIFDLSAKEKRWGAWCHRYEYFNAQMIAVSRSMGRHVQGDALELWAQQIPWSQLPMDWSPVQIHALFFLVAGHLDGITKSDPFIHLLLSQQEVFLWANLHHRSPINWRKRVSLYSRSHLKIAQIAQLYLIIRENKSEHWWSPTFFSRALEFLNVPEYWRWHYQLGQLMQKPASIELSEQAIETIVFNLSAFMFDQNVPYLKKNTTDD